MPRNYCEIALDYANRVVAGKVPACQYVIQACQRQLDDLQRSDWRWHYEEARAARICKFIELLPHIKGKWARERRLIELEPWQIWLLTTLFGWVDEHGLRRFKTAYIEVPRKNAKSTLSSGIALYLLAADEEEGAEIYSAATTRDQARIVWSDAKRMAERSLGLQHRFGVEASAHSVFVEHSASKFAPLSRDQGGNHDGYSVHGAIVDELHGHKTRDIWDVLETATGAREQPLILAITTAGFNRAGICYEQRAYTLKLLNGAANDDEYFGVVYTIDDDDDWTDPAVWAKANPNWGVSVDPDDIARKARKAMEMSSAQNNFLTKHLNRWVNADTAWMDMIAWDRCGDAELTLDDFRGRPVWLGLDLASKIDIASLAIIARNGDQYDVLVRHYLPEEAAEGENNSQYSGWSRDGRITTTPGNITDQAAIEDDIRQMAADLDVQLVAYDPWQSTYLATRLMEEGLPMVELRQTVQNMNEPMKQLEALAVSGKLRHSGCPVLSWMVSNVVGHLDAKDNIYPRKEFPQNKIDGVIALLMALGRAMLEDAADSDHIDQGFVAL